MKKILDDIDNWKAERLDTRVRHNLNMAQNSFGEVRKQYESRATIHA